MDSGFHHDQTLNYGPNPNPNRHAISFQSSAVDSTSEMIMMGDYYRMNNNNNSNSTAGMMFSGNSCSSARISSVHSDLVPGLKHDAGLAVEWSVEEQYKLEDGVSKYANEPNILRYVKIAATLRDKTVRDVALRCRWITSKRRKQDEQKLGRKFKDKDKLMESSSKASISSISTLNVAPFSVTMNNGIPFEALNVSTRHRLEQNKQVFGQISANISALKLQENADLFKHAKNNITTILKEMKYMPGPPLPVSLNENLANTILVTTSQTMTFGPSSRMQMKQEPDY